jgi:hypothetical protein
MLKILPTLISSFEIAGVLSSSFFAGAAFCFLGTLFYYFIFN